MGEPARSIANHQVNPITGFIENPAYAYDFDSDKKLFFLSQYKANGLSLYTTCEEMGISHTTVLKHFRQDDAFHEAFKEAEREYYDKLEGRSRNNAMLDKSVVERIFQLNAGSRKGLTRGKYVDDKSSSATQVTINVDGELLKAIAQRERVIDAIPIEEIPQSKPELSQRGDAS